MKENELSNQIIGMAIDVHRHLGPGLLESAYRECLAYELKTRGIHVEKEKPMPIVYKGIRLDHGYRMDLLIENRLVVEVKTVEVLTDVHLAQILTYLRLGNYPLGLVINFNVTLSQEWLEASYQQRGRSRTKGVTVLFLRRGVMGCPLRGSGFVTLSIRLYCHSPRV